MMFALGVKILSFIGFSNRLAKQLAWVPFVLAFVALIAGAFFWLATAERKDDEANRQIGRTEERAKVQEQVIENVEKANEARNTLRADCRAFYDQCLRTARTPANCERLLCDSPKAER